MKTLIAFAVALFFYSIAGIASACCGLVELSVYDRAQDTTLPQYTHNGKAYIVGTPGNEYQLVIRNPSSERVLAVVSVDGINAVSGETASPKQTGYVLDPGGSVEVKGWRKSLSNTAAFYFTEHNDSYAARTGRGENTGVIGIAVFKAKAPAPAALSQPYYENAKGRADYAPKEKSEAQETKRLGTGHGRIENSQAQFTSFERASSTPDQIVSLYYDSYRNLVAQGVLQPREPEAFPGCFVPDPPRS